MKGFRFWFAASFVLILACHVASVAQEQEPLKPEWLAEDYQSVELISLLASPTPLTVQGIRDILGVGDDGEEKDLGFGASTFDIAKGHGYTGIYVEGFVFRGTIGFYKVGIRGSSESWPRIRERVIDLWKHNHGPDFTESDSGLVYTETKAAVFLAYRSAVSAELGEMKRVEVTDELKKAFDYLTLPLENWGIGGTEGDMAIHALVNANRIDLIENVLRGFNPGGRVYAALALLKLSKANQCVLSADTVGTIAKVSNLDISITTGSGCIINRRTAKEILSDLDESEPELPEP
jgi:hypothetical protein